jgi:hypothetical protein
MLKLQLESSMDPLLKVHSDIHDMIFQHLSFVDVLKCSQVSTDWNWSIGTSSKCLSKIQLKFDDSQSEAKLRQLINTKREYRNLRLTIKDESIPNRALRLLQKLAPTLLDLKLIIVLENIEIIPELVDFPKLESLDITGRYLKKHSEYAYSTGHGTGPLKLQVEGYFKNVTTLKKLRIGFALTNDSKISDWIMKQRKLEELTFSCWTDYIFENDLLADASFPLRSFEFSGFAKGNRSIQIANFHKFLLKMSESLTFLIISNTQPETIEFAVNNLPNLKKFHCYNIKGDISNLKLKPNKSIIELKLTEHKSKQTETLFKSLVNLEVLKTTGIDKTDLKWIFRNMKTLKKLDIQRFLALSCTRLIRFNLKECEAVYEELKESGEDINRDIELLSELEF